MLLRGPGLHTTQKASGSSRAAWQRNTDAGTNIAFMSHGQVRFPLGQIWLSFLLPLGMSMAEQHGWEQVRHGPRYTVVWGSKEGIINSSSLTEEEMLV